MPCSLYASVLVKIAGGELDGLSFRRPGIHALADLAQDDLPGDRLPLFPEFRANFLYREFGFRATKPYC
jgi:hypothetical protein